MYLYFKKVLSVLSLKQKYSFYFLNFFLIVASILETLSIIAIIPVARLITDGKKIFENYPKLSFLEEYISIFQMGVEKVLVFFMFLIAIIFICKNLILTLIYYFKEKYFFSVRSYVMETIYKKYIFQDYSSRSKKNSSLFINNIINETSLIVDMGIKNYVNLCQEISIVSIMIIFLFILNPVVTLGSLIFLLMLFFIIYIPSKKIIKKYSHIRQNNEEKRIQDLNETFENFKYIKILSLEKFFLKIFSIQNTLINKSQYIISFISILPIKFFETCLILGLFLMCFFLVRNSYSIGDITTILLAYSLCGIRMLPSLNKIFVYLQSLKYVYPAIDKVYEDLSEEIVVKENKQEKIDRIENLNLSIEKFFYQENKIIFFDTKICIEKGDKVFLKGPTGSGKTSLINLITGLIKSENVKIELNGKKINNEDKLYKKIDFGYVPQDTFLSNTSFKDNINLNHKYNSENFHNIISICDLSKFLDNLPDKENTVINERSANISGGQKQRIAIARALMSNSQILILDEATNALDEVTEKKVLEDIIKNYPNLIIIIISHKNTLQKYCNKIYEVKDKKLFLSKK